MRSSLEIFDIETGETSVVLQSTRLFEAPNWLPDDSGLIINGEGRLFRVGFDIPHPRGLDTGFAVKCNNDHGVSPDGQRIVISDSSEEGASCIYTLPVEGGAPERVTPLTPSWWHGWSPDGATLAYVGKRDGAFDIHTCPVGGGAETRLTDGAGHHDGPDYTPDGRWIWFNSDREGAMSLWRIHPDGSGLERMTAGDSVDWFPHPSPDGRHVLYLSYAPGTEGHPRDRDVELRLMPAEGGEARTLLSLFGGQGSINVPCWAPDSRRFAFMRYAPE